MKPISRRYDQWVLGVSNEKGQILIVLWKWTVVLLL
jgi:hypothetical protein